MFVLSQAARDVYFSNIFQEIDIFEIIVFVFSITIFTFSFVTFVKSPMQAVFIFRLNWLSTLGMNVSTAGMWIFYFFALRLIEPSLVNMLFSATGLVAAVIFSQYNTIVNKTGTIRNSEYFFYGGIVMTIGLIWLIVLVGASGYSTNPRIALIGLTLTMMSGISGTLSTLFERRLNEHAVHPQAVVATRFILLALIALSVEVVDQADLSFLAAKDPSALAVALLVLILLPTWIVQIAVAMTSPITFKAILALAPIFVFALQKFDPRIEFSGPVLVVIILYSIFVIGSNVVRGWESDPAICDKDIR